LVKSVCAALFAALIPASLGQQSPKVSLDTSESMFAVMAAINACGYDEDLSTSNPVRAQIRAEVGKAIQALQDTREVAGTMCQFYADHKQPEASRTLAEYVSLGLYLEPPPTLATKVKEADLPPDAAYVSGIVPLLAKFYQSANLHAIWQRHQDVYADLQNDYHEPLSKMLFDTEIYLRLPSAGYLGHAFTVFLEPLGSPAQTNARNYGPDYFVVISPGVTPALKVQQIRHTYLHYLLDPMALKYPEAMKRLDPLLENVKTAPMDESFKSDVSLLITECLIRAVEIRTTIKGEPEQQREVQSAARQGFILTQYFYDALAKFEKGPEGLRNAYGTMLVEIDLHKEQKLAQETQFATAADQELLHLSRPAEGKLLTAAEQKLTTGDPEGAQKLAQQALDDKSEDPARALFILAQAATMTSDLQGARGYFMRALEVAHEPKVVAWSHIYLGRIYDIQEDRGAAVDQYKAALVASAQLPEAKAAAEKGLETPYEPPSHPH
jgi:tetratricopeptide (TPR) repeat protein